MNVRSILAAVVALFVWQGSARAGLLNKDLDFVYVDGTLAAEYEHIGFTGGGALASTGGSSDTWGLAYGAEAGFRLGKLSIGALYQRTDVLSGANNLDLNKLYAEVGLNLRIGILMIVLHVDLGWAFANSGSTLPLGGSTTFQGVGAKGGVAFDFYPIRILSIGVGADFDVQGYSLPSSFVSSLGATFGLRVGLHI